VAKQEESEPVGKGTFTMYAEELLGQADTRIPATTRNVDGVSALRPF
jgi:hypothetical protein